MVETAVEKSLEVSVESSLTDDGYAIINVTKIYGNVNLKHRGQELMGGMNWVPDGALPVGIQVQGETHNNALNVEQMVVLFQDLLQTLMPAVEVLVRATDKEDF